MKYYTMSIHSFIRASAAVLLIAGILGFQAKAEVLNFDDLGSGLAPLPADYAGLTWTNWNYYDLDDSPYDPSSGAVRAFNTFGFTATIQFGTDVTLNSFWLAGYNAGQYIEGWNKGSMVFSTMPRLEGFEEFGEYYMLNWAGIDELQFKSPEGNYYVVDDITFNAVPHAPGVPDGGLTVGMLGAAMLSLIGLRRVRR